METKDCTHMEQRKRRIGTGVVWGTGERNTAAHNQRNGWDGGAWGLWPGGMACVYAA
jgi:hypothetical protein